MTEPRVLIIDDNPLNVELATYVLEDAAFVVHAIADAADVMDRIRAFRPDVILMDIQLPDVDGLALTRLLKADPSTHNIAIAAFTAFAMKGDEAKMRAAGCDGYIAKPINIATFASQVREVIRSPSQA